MFKPKKTGINYKKHVLKKKIKNNDHNFILRVADLIVHECIVSATSRSSKYSTDRKHKD